MDAVIFDFDGTLADSEGIHDEAMRIACAESGVETVPGVMVGLPDPEGVRRAFMDAGRVPRDEEVDRILQRKRALVHDAVAGGRVALYPGVQELLVSLAEAGVALAVCSAARRSEIEPILEVGGLREMFRVVVAVEDVTVSKPDPSCYRLSAERIGVAIERCVAVEDSVHGVRSAVDAGAYTVAVAQTTDLDRLSRAHHAVGRIGELHVNLLRQHHASWVAR